MVFNEERTREIMDKHGIDILVATLPENVYYMSNFMSQNQQVLFSSQINAAYMRGEPRKLFLILPIGEIASAAHYCPIDKIEFIPYGSLFRESSKDSELSEMDLKIRDITKDPSTKKNHAEAIVEFLKPYISKRYKVGLDERGIDNSTLEHLKKIFPSSSIAIAYSVFQEIRMIKTGEEIQALRKAVQITEEGIQAALSLRKGGVTEQDMAIEFEKTIAMLGAQRAYTVINFGSQGAYGALRPTNRVLKKGDLIRFDIGCRYHHYYSDVGRTFIFGEPSSKHKKYYAALLEGQNQALELIRDGVLPKELFNKGVWTARKVGIPHYKRHGIGHGIGLEFYDPPLINPNTSIPLQEGMVINIELPYYELGFGGLIIEDTLLVKKSGYELLTQSSRELEIL